MNQLVRHDVSRPFPLQDASVDVVVTSPPYWGLRDYGEEAITVWGGREECRHEWGGAVVTSKTGGINSGCVDRDGWRQFTSSSSCVLCGAWRGQLGLEPHPQQYINHLVGVFREVKRVLRPTGSFYLNLGDTYFGGGGGNYGDGLSSAQGNTHPTNFLNRLSSDGKWLQPKQLLMIPERVAMALQEDGWILRNKLVWVKPNHMPSSVRDRRASSWENVFHFVKAPRYQFDLDAIREPHHTTEKWATSKKIPIGRSMMSWERGGIEQSMHPNGKNPGDVLEITTAGSPEAHYAVFPDELVRRLLLPHAVQYCMKCGMPRTRIIENNNPSKDFMEIDDITLSGAPDSIQSRQSIKSLHRNSGPNGQKGVYYSGKFIGWSDCGCVAGWRPSVVLDPFGGRGTTGKVAKELDMGYVLFDIDPRNLEIAGRYISRSELANYRKHEQRRNSKPVKALEEYL